MKPHPHPVRHGLFAGLLLLSLPASARPLQWDVTDTSWLGGATHPILEYEHAIALLLVGVTALLLGGRNRWGLPILYAALLGGGLVLGSQGAMAPMFDTIAMTAALALVLLILGQVHVVYAVVTTAIGAFALFHGVADGFLMAQGRVGLGYEAGYLASSVLVLLAGMGVGEWIQKRHLAWSEHVHDWFSHFHGMRLGG